MRVVDYYRTAWWGRRAARRPRGDVKDAPYYRAVDLALRGVKSGYGVKFPPVSAYSLLEFGVFDGSSFEKMLRFRDVVARRLRLEKRVVCIGFDTFDGLPEQRPEDVAAPWLPGDFVTDLDKVRTRLSRYRDFELVKGLFSETLPDWRDRLEQAPPVFVSIDCDYYSSTIDALQHVLPNAPTGCFFYFDDVAIHYFSDRAGELQAVREVNEGRFGEHLQLAEYPLWIETGEMRHYRQLYRLLNLERGGLARARPDGDLSRFA